MGEGQVVFRLLFCCEEVPSGKIEAEGFNPEA